MEIIIIVGTLLILFILWVWKNRIIKENKKLHEEIKSRHEKIK